MGMMGAVGSAAHKGAPDKAAEMLSMQQSPTAEKVCRNPGVACGSEVPVARSLCGLHTCTPMWMPAHANNGNTNGDAAPELLPSQGPSSCPIL